MSLDPTGSLVIALMPAHGGAPPGLTPPVGPAPPDLEVGVAGAASVEGVVGAGAAGDGFAGAGVAGAASGFGVSPLDSPPPPVAGVPAGAPLVASPVLPLVGLLAAGGAVAVVSIVFAGASA